MTEEYKQGRKDLAEEIIKALENDLYEYEYYIKMAVDKQERSYYLGRRTQLVAIKQYIQDLIKE